MCGRHRDNDTQKIINSCVTETLQTMKCSSSRIQTVTRVTFVTSQNSQSEWTYPFESGGLKFFHIQKAQFPCFIVRLIKKKSNVAGSLQPDQHSYIQCREHQI